MFYFWTMLVIVGLLTLTSCGSDTNDSNVIGEITVHTPYAGKETVEVTSFGSQNYGVFYTTTDGIEHYTNLPTEVTFK